MVRFSLSLLFENDRSGTLAANLIGVSLATIFLVFIDRRRKSELQLLLLPGFCAGLTTFSAVTADSLEPNNGGVIFLLQNIILSLLIIAIVLPLARKLIPVRR